MINHLFNHLAGVFPAWRQAFDGPESVRAAKRIWFLALTEAGIKSMPEIERGIRRSISSKSVFLPSAGQFAEWCRLTPEELGLPSAHHAWVELCHRKAKKPYSHPVLLAIANDRRCDIYNWRLLVLEKGLALFTPIYREYVERVAKGEVFVQPVMIERDNEPKRFDRALTPEQKAEIFAQARQLLKTARPV